MKPLPRQSLLRQSVDLGAASTRGHKGADLAIEVPKVLFVTSEITDFVKTGGLGDVSAALPRALRQTTDVRVLIPGYPQVTRETVFTAVARLPAVAGLPACEVGKVVRTDGLVIYVLLCPDLYDREGSPYGDLSGTDWADNDVRFARLSLAAAEIAAGTSGLGWTPDLVHVNDWPSSLTPAYLAWRGANVPSILTIHNLAYQGLFDPECMLRLAIPQEAFNVDGVEFHGRVSFLKSGIYYASQITTVSSTYAREITTPEFGCGLDGLLRTRTEEGRVSGIINGIDDSWEPREDTSLVSPFDEVDMSGRHANTHAAREAFQLKLDRGPLFAIISRLVHQKGIDLVLEAADRLVSEGGQLAVMGQGETEIENALRSVAQRHPGSVSVKVGFDEAEARRLFAGSDFLLMPSRFEPCGLSQMYAQRYGSLPIVNETGGLADTVEDEVNGFVIKEPSPQALQDGLSRAFGAFASKQRLHAMRRAAMKRPVRWAHSARRYGELYHRHLSPATS